MKSYQFFIANRFSKPVSYYPLDFTSDHEIAWKFLIWASTQPIYNSSQWLINTQFNDNLMLFFKKEKLAVFHRMLFDFFPRIDIKSKYY